MAAGLPIISTNVGGVADIITDNGILVEPGNRNQLSEAMALVINDKTLWTGFSVAAIENVKKYDIKYAARKYEKLYLNDKTSL